MGRICTSLCSRLNVCVPPMHVLNRSARCAGVWRRGLWGWLGCDGGALLNGICALPYKRDWREIPCFLCQWADSEKTSTREEGAFPRHQMCWCLHLDLSAFRNVRNKFLRFASYPVYGIFGYNSPDRLRQLPRASITYYPKLAILQQQTFTLTQFGG